ncbi:MAG: hypothetical protein R2707_12225 [Acidimicrobiales bacterium]
MNLRRGALLTALALALVAGVGVGAWWLVFRDDAPSESAVTWALIDAVPAHQKSGVFVRAGLDYEPLLDDAQSQERARLTLTRPSGMLAIAPERAANVPFDGIVLEGLQVPIAGSETMLFVIDEAGALTVFAPRTALDDCVTRFSVDEPFAGYGLVGDIGGLFEVTGVECFAFIGDEVDPDESGSTTTTTTTTSTVEELLVEELAGAMPLAEMPPVDSSSEATPAPAPTMRAFGALFSVPVDDVAGLDPITVTSLALTDSTQRISDSGAALTVEIRNKDLALAARTEDPADDSSLSVVHVLGSGGERSSFTMNDDGSFSIDLDELPSRLKIWFDDYGLEHYVRQGAWVDTDRLTRHLEIDLEPVFEPTGEPPPPSPQNRNPHELRVWNGSTRMEVQEYAGYTYTNNFGRADRDRSTDNPNGCDRVAYLGGSYVEAVQTRIDQKAGIIAEATLSTRRDRCVEVLTVGRSVFSVESHYGNAVSLVEDFGVEHLIFNISSTELCRMDDLAYEMANGVARDTPTTWRYVGGRFVAPVLRGEIVEVDEDPDFELDEYCNFTPGKDDLTVERALFAKLAAMHEELVSLDTDLEVTFLLMKDAYADTDIREQRLDLLLSFCDEFDVPCALVDPPELFKPDELLDDFSPYLYRYLGDGHPNPRANQYTAETLVEVIESALPS